MKKLAFLVLLISTFSFAQTSDYNKDSISITTMLNTQKYAWNNYDIEAFMQGYWKSDELTFYGSGGVVKGWQATLERYKKSYPTRDHFGKLDFIFNEISPISEGVYYVMGEYYLTRSVGDANGIFMLVVKRIEGDWKVIADTSVKVR